MKSILKILIAIFLLFLTNTMVMAGAGRAVAHAIAGIRIRNPVIERIEPPEINPIRKRAFEYVGQNFEINEENSITYLEKTEDGFYLKSNFHEIVGGKEKIFTSIDDLNTALAEYKGEIILNENMFDENGVPIVDLTNTKKIKIDKTIASNYEFDQNSKIEKLEINTPPPILISKIDGCCLYSIPPFLANFLKLKLSKMTFQRNDVKFLSLVSESGTNFAIKKSKFIKSKLVSKEQITSFSLLEKAFKKSQGKTLVLLSHVEKDKFVTRNAAQQITFEIPIEFVRELADKYDIKLIDLGCNTAQTTKMSGKIGVMSKFNTVDAVNAIENALLKSKNYSEFLQNIAQKDSGLKLVLNEKFAHKKSMKVDIYARVKSKGSEIWIKIATIFFSKIDLI